LAEIELRAAEEIQAAHDRLVAILTGDVPNPFQKRHALQNLRVAAGVLCWALNHDHNQDFAATLEEIDAFMTARGLLLRDSGRLQTPRT
jgi:hypothetical protein